MSRFENKLSILALIILNELFTPGLNDDVLKHFKYDFKRYRVEIVL